MNPAEKLHKTPQSIIFPWGLFSQHQKDITDLKKCLGFNSYFNICLRVSSKWCLAHPTVEEAPAAFGTLAAESELNDEALQSAFWQGLNDMVQDALVAGVRLWDFDELVDRLVELDNYQQERCHRCRASAEGGACAISISWRVFYLTDRRRGRGARLSPSERCRH